MSKALVYRTALAKKQFRVSVLLGLRIKLERKYKFKLLSSSTFKLIEEKAATMHISQVL